MSFLRHLPTLAQKLAVVVNVIILIYLIVYASACPIVPLVCAVAFEIAFFIGILGYRRWKSSTKTAKKASEALDFLEANNKPLFVARRGLAAVGLAASTLCCLFLSVDLIALTLARSDNLGYAMPIYKVMAPPAVMGVHPAFSLELLAGAYVESHQPYKAQPIEHALVDLRAQIYGEKSESVAAIYADLGDFYRKHGNLQYSAFYYSKAVELSRTLNLSQGWGSPATRLGAVYAAEGLYAESQEAFTDAIAIRTKIFGENSVKVAETLKHNAALLRAIGKTAEAQRMQVRVDQINRNASKSDPNQAWDLIPLMVLAVSLIFLSQRDRLIILAAEIQKNRIGKQSQMHSHVPEFSPSKKPGTLEPAVIRHSSAAQILRDD